ncbi:MAG: hypothetical protein ABEJ72_10585 [Candidatus Aenigmatarchaeota archaeon]
MFPEKYVKDVESSVKRNKAIQDILVSSSFIASFVLLGPLIHEFGHIIVLKLIGCGYFLDLGFSMPHGIFASIEPLCSPSTPVLIIFYMLGYLLTLGLGTLLVFTGSRSKYLAALGTGSLLSVTLTIGLEGDIQNTAILLGISSFTPVLTALIILGIFITSLRGIEKMI